VTHHLFTTLFLAGLATGCSPTYLPPESTPLTPGSSMPDEFVQSGREVDVPSEVLFALAKVETGFQMVTGDAEFDGQDRAFGMMALRGENLELAAELSGIDLEQIKTDRYANLSAAAYLLAAFADEEGVTGEDPLSAWAPVIARYSGISDAEAVAEYIHHDVYAALREGIEIEGYRLDPMEVVADWPLPTRDLTRGRDQNTVWSPSPNYNSRSGTTPKYVIIHTCEGSYSSCWSWLTNSSSGVSAHYVVNEQGTEVRSLVDEANRAWHISANYDCSLNGSTDCSRNGTSMNTLSVGIEHAGYGSQSSWSTGLIQRSAELTCGITQRNSIPRDSYHVIAHGRMQPWNRTDPGPNWPWTDYLNRVKAECGDIPGGSTGGGGSSGGGGGSSGGGGGSSGGTPTGPQFVIDSNNAANNTSSYLIEISSSWRSSANVSGYYNTGYWYAPTGEISDPAKFKFYADADKCYDVEAWWPAASDRPSNTAYIGYDAAGAEVGRGWVNQQVNGGRFNRLGTWEFKAGWNSVSLSRWTTAGKNAVADAVRLTEVTCN
jgi:hypothetical protein